MARLDILFQPVGRRGFLKFLGTVAGGAAIGLNPILNTFAEGTHHVLVPPPPDLPIAVEPEEVHEIQRLVELATRELPPYDPRRIALFNQQLHDLTHATLRHMGEQLSHHGWQRQFELQPERSRMGDTVRLAEALDWNVQTFEPGQDITQTYRDVCLDEQYSIDGAWKPEEVVERSPRERAEFIEHVLAAPAGAAIAKTVQEKGLNLFAPLPLLPKTSDANMGSVLAVDPHRGLALRGILYYDLSPLSYAFGCYRFRLDILGAAA